MITPSFLQSGDTIGLIAPAYHIDSSQWEPVVSILQEWGLKIKPGDTLQLQDRVFAGTDSQRLHDLVSMMSDPDIKAVLCARGGYGCLRLLPELDRFSQSFTPKWLIGYSDVTVLLSYCIDHLHWPCIHGPMPIDISSGCDIHSWDYLRDILFGKMPVYTLTGDALNRTGRVKASLVGGNLSVLHSLNATPWQLQTDNRILFIEDVNENLYHLDRMMTNMRLGGRLAGLKGLLLGSMTGMKDGKVSFDRTAYEIIQEHVREYDYPVAFGFPAGHDRVNHPLVLGSDVQLDVTTNSATLEWTR